MHLFLGLGMRKHSSIVFHRETFVWCQENCSQQQQVAKDTGVIGWGYGMTAEK